MKLMSANKYKRENWKYFIYAILAINYDKGDCDITYFQVIAVEWVKT